MKVKFLFICALAIGLFQTSFGQQPTATQGYMLGPGDVISIRVLGEPDFTVEKATIDEDGKVQIPYAEQGLMAKCKTEKDIRAEVIKIYSRMLRNPQVTVQVNERKSRPPVTVSGQVRTPAQIELRRSARLLELITFSGGVTEESNGMIQVFRTQLPMCSEADTDGNWRTAESKDVFDVPSRMYSLTTLMQGSDEANPIIYSGDVIVVQKAAPIYITGEVVSPQGIYLKEGGLSLTEAIAKIGGVRREAKTKDIKIYRLKPNSKDREIISVNYDLIKKGTQKDVMLEPYDIVEVDKSKKSVWQIALELATGVGKQGLGAVTSGLGNRVLY